MSRDHREEPVHDPVARQERAEPPDPAAEHPVRFYADATYMLNRGLPHVVDFAGRPG